MTKRDLKLGLLASLFVTVLSLPTAFSVLNVSTLTVYGVSLTLGVLTIAGLYLVHFLSRWVKVFWQMGKFIVTGGINTFLDFAVLNVLILLTGIAGGVGYALFKGISFTSAVVNSYFWNKYWTFEASDKNKKAEFIQFIGVSVVGILINVGVASVVVNFIPPLWGLGIVQWANLSALTATVLSWAWNFLGYKLIVFKHQS